MGAQRQTGLARLCSPGGAAPRGPDRSEIRLPAIGLCRAAMRPASPFCVRLGSDHPRQRVAGPKMGFHSLHSCSRLAPSVGVPKG